ncbi:MAG: aromatic amino acid lyase [Streptosporangiales bacterium]|nr:aromatic amino acid lyase [Streptosporangiales bacterium]
MRQRFLRTRRILVVLVAIGLMATLTSSIYPQEVRGSTQAVSAYETSAYTTVNADGTVTADGKRMSIGDIVDVARNGAKIRLTSGARQRSLNAYYLLLQGAREGVPVYWFNRAAGSGRQEVIFSGDPLSTKVTSDSPTCPTTGQRCSNRDYLLQSQLRNFRSGATGGSGPEASREVVRAMMAFRVNTMSYEAASPQLTQMLVDLLNKDVTPVVQSRGSPGEGDLPQLGNVAATMVGVGYAYFHGKRMTAKRALAEAGLKPLQDQPAQPLAPGAPFAADEAALTSSNAYSMGQAALHVHDAQQALNWQDLLYAMDLQAMNSSITPLAAPVRAIRPDPQWKATAARVLDMIKGSYLLARDEESEDGVPKRIIQDPESLRAMSQRNAAAWTAWKQLRDALLIQINASDHNPSVAPGWSPSSAPELNEPWLKQYYVKGGPNTERCVGKGLGGTGCGHGYILSNANWDPYPVANEIEALTNALANCAVTDAMVPLRFESTFFTVIEPSYGLTAQQQTRAAPRADSYALADLLQSVHTHQNPIPVEGNSIVANVEDLQASTSLKVAALKAMLTDLGRLQAQSLLTATYWLNIREIQGEKLNMDRSFGTAPTAAWKAFRKVVPWQSKNRPPKPPGEIAYSFLRSHPATTYYPRAVSPP